MMAIFVVGSLNSVLQVLIYCLLVGGVFVIEELLYNAKREQRARLKEEAMRKKGKK